MRKKILILALILGMIGSVSASQQGWYHLNESSSPSLDYSGNNNDLTWQGDPQSTTGVTKNDGDWGTGEALDFDGSGDYLTASDGSYGVDGASKVSISMWTNFDTWTNHPNPRIFKKGTSSNDNSIRAWIQDDGIARINANNGGSGCIGDGGNVSIDEYTHSVITFDLSNNEMRHYVNGSKKATISCSLSSIGTSTGNFKWFGGTSENPDAQLDEPQIFVGKAVVESEAQNLYNCNSLTCNQPPQFDSTDVTPDPPLIGEDVSYTANTSDPDGSVEWLNLTVYDDGSQVYTDSQNSPTDGNYTWSNIYSKSDAGDLDAYFEVEDDAGAVTTEWLNRTLTDDAPSVTLNDPKNQSYFKYGVPVDFSVSDSDAEPGEDWNCDIDKDGSLYEEVYLKEGTNSSYTGTIESDKGSHTGKVECTDGSGNTGSASEDYTVKRFEIQSTSANSPVFETENTTYTGDVKAGSMVNELDTRLYWNQTERDTVKKSNSGINTYSNNHYFQPPLVKNNDTTENWRIEAEINYTDFQSSTTSKDSRNSSTVSQDIYHAYHTPSTVFNRSKVVEKEDIFTELTYTNELSPGPASKSSNLTFNGETQTAFNYSFDTPLVGSNNANIDKDASGKLTVSFRNRQFDRDASNDTLTIHKKILTDCTNSVNGKTGDKAHVYTLYNEEDRSQKLTGDIDYNFDTTHHGEHSRNYNFTNSGVKTSDLCLYPAWTDLEITGPIDYGSDENQNSNNKTYPKRDRRFVDHQINNNTENINLYLLEEGLATDVIFKVVDSASDPISNVDIKTMRYFAGLNSFITVTNVNTDSNGEAPTKLKEDISYKYLLTKDGKVLKETDKSKLSCSTVPCTKTFQIGNEISPYFQVEEGFSYKLEKLKDQDGNVTGLQASVTHDSGTLQNASFKVEKQGVIGWENTCDITTQSSGQSMVCDFNETLEGNTFQYSVQGTKNGQTYTLTTGSLSDGQGLFGKSNPWAAAMLFLVITGLGLRSPKTSIAFSTAGAVAAWWIGLITVSVTAIASLVIVALMVMATGDT